METPPAPVAPAKKPNLAAIIFICICGLISMGFGVVKIVHGIQEMRGGSLPAEVQQALKDIEVAVDAGNKASLEAQPLFQALLTGVDEKGLDHIRQNEAAKARQTIELFDSAAAQFQAASDKCREAERRVTSESKKQFLLHKAASYRLLAHARTLNRQIVDTVLSPSIPNVDALVPKVTEMGKQRDDLAKQADDEQAQAEQALGKKSA